MFELARVLVYESIARCAAESSTPVWALERWRPHNQTRHPGAPCNQRDIAHQSRNQHSMSKLTRLKSWTLLGGMEEVGCVAPEEHYNI
eukprot:5928167-Heterocapsa_arctica.AAC.1